MGDLLAGAGGLSDGFRRAGDFVTIAGVEIEPTSAATFALNHPGAETFTGDIAAWLSGGGAQNVDVLTGPMSGFLQLGPSTSP